jgi:8-oxo-dGTP pyrophosphatase MutT (NUDIX family)
MGRGSALASWVSPCSFARLGISPYLKSLRERIGHELVLLPAVAVLPWDEAGRLLMVREAQTGLWQTVGGAIDPDEAPHDAAVREAMEEIGTRVALDRIRAVTGGSQYRLRYPNGDLVSYVSIVFDARVSGGAPRADGEETLDAQWFSVAELSQIPLTDFTVTLLSDPAVGVLQSGQSASPREMPPTPRARPPSGC